MKRCNSWFEFSSANAWIFHLLCCLTCTSHQCPSFNIVALQFSCGDLKSITQLGSAVQLSKNKARPITALWTKIAYAGCRWACYARFARSIHGWQSYTSWDDRSGESCYFSPIRLHRHSAANLCGLHQRIDLFAWSRWSNDCLVDVHHNQCLLRVLTDQDNTFTLRGSELLGLPCQLLSAFQSYHWTHI